MVRANFCGTVDDCARYRKNIANRVLEEAIEVSQ